MRVKKIAFTILSGALAVGVMAGCTDKSKDDSDGVRVPASSASSTSAPANSEKPADGAKPSDGGIVKGKGVIKQTKMTECSTKPGDLLAKGTYTAKKGQEGTPTISVSWVNPKGSVIARGAVEVKGVTAEKAVPWEIKAKTNSKEKLSCVVGAVIPE